MSLQFHAVAKRYGGTTIFSDVCFTVGAGQKVALIGPNGGGKSTLLRLAAGLEPPDAGGVTATGRVALLEQVTGSEGRDALAAVTPPLLRRAAAELAAAQLALVDPTPDNLLRHAEAEEHYRVSGGYEFEARAETVLNGLGLKGARVVDGLSGGQARRLHLARQLLTPAEIYLLDEPTNHLDAQGLEWLAGWVRSSPATMLIVSHDRAFLDTTVSAVAELERGAVHVWPGNYSEAMRVKEAERDNRMRLHQTQVRAKRKLELEAARVASRSRSADKFDHRRAGNQALILAKAKAENVSRTLARRAKAMEARVEKFEVAGKPFEDRRTFEIPLPDVPYGPTDVLQLQEVEVRREGRTLVTGLNLTLRRGEKLALLGPNGSGKTSLLEVALGSLRPTAGSVTLNAEPFVVTQHGTELDEYDTLETALRAAQPELRRQDLYYLLARMGLPNDPQARVATLSGGERTRLALARLTVTRAPLLVLDEPTNHLDIRMVEALEELLVDYPGAVLLASHDRRLVAAVASRTLTLDGEGGDGVTR